MAVETIEGGVAQRWGIYKPGQVVFTWNSVDLKPQTPPSGSIGYEWDTGLQWVWSGVTWMLNLENKALFDVWFPSCHGYGVTLRSLAANVETGTFSHPLRIDPTGTTRQPVELGPYSYRHIATTGTTVVKAAPGFLHALIVNDSDGSLVTVYDSLSASGQIIAIVKTSAAPPPTPVPLPYNVIFMTGLTLRLAGSPDLTVSYR